MEESAAVIQHVLFLIIVILALGIFSGRLAAALRIPDVVLFIVAGIIAGQGAHLVTESSSSFTNQFILTLGSTLILFDGGRNIKFSGLRKVWITVTMLSIPGVLITVAVTAVAAHFLFNIPYLYAVLLGSIIASTDPATIIPVFKQVRIREKLRETVESESAFNDATGSILTFTVLGLIAGGQTLSLAHSVQEFLVTAIGGLLVGAAIGFIASYLVAHLHFGFFQEYTTIAMIVTALGAYWIGQELHVSGFMATFTAGLFWGNSSTFGLVMEDKRHEMDHFSDNITVIMRMLIFVLLGSQVNFQVIWQYFLPGIVLMVVFMFIARPLTVIACAWIDRKAKWEWKEMAFMMWVRETGVIPAALAGMAASMGIEHVDVIASVTFLAIMLTILLQASTTAMVARKLGIDEKQRPLKHTAAKEAR